MRALLLSLRPCDRQQYLPGHFTASAFVVAPTHACTLLIAHPTLGLWLQPGGHIEADDTTPLMAAQREVLEETGLRNVEFVSTLFDIDVHDIPARGELPAHRHYDLRFLGVVNDLPAVLSPEGVRVEWVALAHLDRYTPDESVHRMATKYLSSGGV